MQIAIWIQGRAENSSPLYYEISIKAFGRENQNKPVNLQKYSNLKKIKWISMNTLRATVVVVLYQKLYFFFEKSTDVGIYFYGELSIFFCLFLKRIRMSPTTLRISISE